MSIFISPISWGLGDLVVSLPAVYGLVGMGSKVFLVTRSDLQEELVERIPGIAGSIEEHEFGSKGMGSDDCYYNLRDHRLQRDYWWGSSEFDRDFASYKINDILAEICSDFGIKADFSLPTPLICKRHIELQDCVVFVPGSDGVYKCWPTEHWLGLQAALRVDGVKTLVIGQPTQSESVKKLIDAGLPWRPTNALVDALDIISSCAGVIGVDTGLTHLAVQQGIPTVMLFRNPPIFLRTYPHCFPIVARDCATECINKALALGSHKKIELQSVDSGSWQCTVPWEQRCMYHIPPEAVLSIIRANQCFIGRGRISSII